MSKSTRDLTAGTGRPAGQTKGQMPTEVAGDDDRAVQNITSPGASMSDRGRRLAAGIHGGNAGTLAPEIRGLIFDMGDVLYDATVWRRWLLKLLLQMGLHSEYESFYRIWDRTYLEPVHRGERDYQESFRAFLSAVGLSAPQIDEVEAASRSQKRLIESCARPFPGVRSTIRSLAHRGIRMAVLSDSEQPAEALSERLATFGLGGMFRAVVSSRDLRRTKPDAVCYRVALEALGLPAAHTAFIGHDVAEIRGASDVGLATIAFNYEAGVDADVYIDHFDALAAVVPHRAIPSAPAA